MRITQAEIETRLAHTAFPEEYARNFSVDERRKLAKEGKAMSDLSFPIVSKDDVTNAVRLARTPAQRAHVKKRAAAVGGSVPDSWAQLVGTVSAKAIHAAADYETCPECKGAGKVEGGTQEGMVKCPECKGLGIVPKGESE